VEERRFEHEIRVIYTPIIIIIYENRVPVARLNDRLFPGFCFPCKIASYLLVHHIRSVRLMTTPCLVCSPLGLSCDPQKSIEQQAIQQAIYFERFASFAQKD